MNIAIQKLSPDNLDAGTVVSFSDELSRYNQFSMSYTEGRIIFDDYFYVNPQEKIGPDSEEFDMGCGSGRWTKFDAPKVGKLHFIDPSVALNVLPINESINFINFLVGPHLCVL